MSDYNPAFEVECAMILMTLTRRCIAFFKCIGYLARDARRGYCFAKLPSIGLRLADYGWKKTGRTQSKEIFGILKPLQLFEYEQPNRRSSYNIKLTTLGQYLYARLCKRVVNNMCCQKQNPTLENVKPDPRMGQNPTLPDQDQIKIRSDNTGPVDMCITPVPQNANRMVKFSDKIESELNALSPGARALALKLFSAQNQKKEIAHKDAYMDTIIRKVISDQAEIDRLAHKDRERSLRMQAETQARLKAQEEANQATPEQRVAFMAELKNILKQAGAHK